MKNIREIEILLVEDDPGDVDLTRETLEESKLLINLQVVGDGEAAMHYLRQEGEYADASRPDLMLLDLNLPLKDGREVLEEVKADQNLASIPVIVLTTSKAEIDIARSYGLGANCFITKPVGFEEFTQVVRSIEDFWFTVVRLPREN